ncbi:MAG: class I SAM-dependent methyltransferase, partial [Patescibacteria group bacterium]|nr:class I SAM-dependent methyltransferase [Patescibacteria group bacterium]
MLNLRQYQLLDFGEGRRLERFRQFVVDRPCPAAEGMPKADPSIWRTAEARFERDDSADGEWRGSRLAADPWTVAHGPVTFELKLTPLGQVGIFPEQADNWDWIFAQAAAAAKSGQALRVLNLFAYTGGSTLAAAAAGAEVVHVDAAKTVVAWARRNARHSGLESCPVRWLVEDASKFVRRELARGNRYDAVILDPPSYGHGRRGEVWRLSKHLPGLLDACAELTGGQPRFLLLTCHTAGFGPEQLA